MLHHNEFVTRQGGGTIGGRLSLWRWVATIACASVLGASVAQAQVPTEEKPAAQAPTEGKSAAPATEQAVAKAGPKIIIEEMTYDFGEVWSGTKVQHAYVVRNDGDSLLKIISVKPSCGCTVAQDYDRQILPGETGKIPITLDTSRLGTKVTKHVTVKSSDPNSETIDLTVSGAVKQRINIDPVRGGSFGRIKPSETIKRTLTLTNNTGKPVDLSVMTPQEGAFRAELKEVEPQQAWELTLSTQPPYQEQYNRGNIKLKTGIEDQPVLDIPANVYVLPVIEVTPPTDLIIPKAQPTTSKQPVRVTFNTDESYRVLSAQVSNPAIETSIDETRPNAYTVTLALPPGYLPPDAGDKLTIATSHPDHQEIAVNIVSRQAAISQQTRVSPAEQLAGQGAPPAEFVTSDGQTIHPEKGGDVSLYMFYASWCGYCKKALPDLDAMSKELKDQGVRFVGVDQDALVEYGADVNNRQARTKEQVEQQWKDLGISFAQAYDPNGAGKSQFRVNSYPTLFLVGKNGKVERVYAGGGAVKDGTLKKDIGELVAGKELAAQDFKAPAPVTEDAPRPTAPAQGLAGQAAPKATFVTTTEGAFNAVEPDHVTFAMFYASWCPHCKKALPKLEELNKSYQDKGVRFVAVSQDTLVEDGTDKSSNPRARTKEQVVGQFKDSGCSFAQAFDPANAGRNQFKVSSFPTMFLIDQGGKVDKVYIGGKAVEDGTLKRDIDALLSKKGSGQARAEGSEAAKVAGR